jgi:hypothetical protein
LTFSCAFGEEARKKGEEKGEKGRKPEKRRRAISGLGSSVNCCS